MVRESEYVSPQSRPPTSKASGIDRMMSDRKVTAVEIRAGSDRRLDIGMVLLVREGGVEGQPLDSRAEDRGMNGGSRWRRVLACW